MVAGVSKVENMLRVVVVAQMLPEDRPL